MHFGPAKNGSFSGIVLLLGFLIGAGPVAAGDDGSVKVEPAGAHRMEATPGQVITAVFRVSNTLDEPRTFTAEIDLPEGWRLVIPLTDFSLLARAEEIRLISFQVPTHTSVGQYQIRYTARDRQNPKASDYGFITIQVLSVYQVDLQLLETPRYVPTGEPYQAEFLAVNEGNVAVTVALQAQSGSGFALRLDSTHLHLPAWATRRFAVTVFPDPNLSAKISHLLRVHARVLEVPDVTAHASSSVAVIPRSERRSRFLKTFPIQMTVQAIGDEYGGGVQAKLEGSGDLLGGHVDVALAYPDQRHRSMYGDEQEYGLRYVRDGLTLYLGDQIYTLTPLTQAGRYGFGAGGKMRAGRFTFGGFYQRSRFYFPPETQRAASLAYQMNRFATFSANYLNQHSFFEDDYTVTLRSVLTPTATTTLDAECSIAGRSNAKNNACMFQLSGEQSWISYTAHYIHAGPEYPGYHRNLDSKSASVMLRPLGWLRLEGSLQKQQQGYVADQQRTYDTYRLGTGLLGHPFGQPAYFFVYYRNKQWAYSQTDFAFERREKAFEVRAGYNVGRTGITGTFGLGRTQNPTLGYTGSFREYQIQTRFASRSGQAFTASVEYLSGTMPFRPEPQHRWLARISAALHLSSRTRFLLNLHGSIERRRTLDRSYRAIQVLFEHRFPSEHRLQVKGLYRSFDAFLDQGIADYTLAYTIPFNVPVPQQKQGKPLTGRVYDAETGEGLKKVVLYLGDTTTMTGSDGTFSFPMPAPGTYYLYFDRLSVGLDRVPQSVMPMEIHVGTEPMPEIEIALVRSARVSGRVEIQQNPDATGTPLDGPPQVVLELIDAVGRHRCLSDRNGRFSFEEVHPGPLTVRVVHARLPAYYYLEQDFYTFDVTPGGQQHVQIRVLPERRQIRMIEGGMIMTGQLVKTPDALRARTTTEPSATPSNTKVQRQRPLEQQR